ncbi:hemerythrin domain-containing protein [Salinimicrobium flavum]|uniref:Hemerythrin domain-containing protein n=1 Tax=Salinimicrobium flavum TaxID=1737065 RepID=A0ABW5IZ81_9FLAO
MNHPLKRHEALKPLSKDHHHGLLLCWKIREGKKRKIATDRIKAYTDFYFNSQLRPHFQFEEEEVFVLLGEDHPMVKHAKAEHQHLERLFKEERNIDRALDQIEKELEAHIRFEERVLFNELQQEVSIEKLENLKNREEEIKTPDPDQWDDKFWLSQE